MAIGGLQRRIENEIECVHVRSQELAIRLRQGTEQGSDEADQANDLVEMARSLALHRQLLQKRRQLVHARARLNSGLAGVCETCGQLIDPARLRAMIGITRCITCQRRSEQKALVQDGRRR